MRQFPLELDAAQPRQPDAVVSVVPDDSYTGGG